MVSWSWNTLDEYGVTFVDDNYFCCVFWIENVISRTSTICDWVIMLILLLDKFVTLKLKTSSLPVTFVEMGIWTRSGRRNVMSLFMVVSLISYQRKSVNSSCMVSIFYNMHPTIPMQICSVDFGRPVTQTTSGCRCKFFFEITSVCSTSTMSAYVSRYK